MGAEPVATDRGNAGGRLARVLAETAKRRRRLVRPLPSTSGFERETYGIIEGERILRATSMEIGAAGFSDHDFTRLPVASPAA